MTALLPPPRAVESEIAVIGALLLNRHAIDDVASILTPVDFYREAHRRIYRAACSLSEAREPIDVVSLDAELRRTGDSEAVGGLDYLAEILDAVPTAANVEYHARLVREKAELRRTIDAAQLAIQDATSGKSAEEVLSDAHARFLAVRRASGGGYVSAGTDLLAVMGDIEREAESGHREGLRTGIPAVDRMTGGGFQPGDLIVLGARPSMGKTSVAVQIAIHAAKSGLPVLFASLEMSRKQLVRRALTTMARVTPDMSTERQSRLYSDAANWLHSLPLRIDERPGDNAESLRAGLHRAARDEPPALIVLDYLQLLEGKGENRVNQVSQVSRACKLIARDMGCPVLVLSQLSRGVEARTPPKPMLSDLRDSGAIEQDADVVLLLWRPEYYFDDRTKPETRAEYAGKGELIVAKQRNGPTGAVKLLWDAPTTTFTEEARL